MRLLQTVEAAAAGLPPWGKAVLVAGSMAALFRGRLKVGYILFVASIAVAVLFGQDVESFANALNHGTTGIATVRLLFSLLSLAWLGQVLVEGGAAGLLETWIGSLPDSRARQVLLAVGRGLLPDPASSEPSASCDALTVWFGRLAGLALPLGPGLVVACELADLPLGRACAMLAPAALGMAAVGLLVLVRSLPDHEPPPVGGGRSGSPGRALAPVLFLVLGAIWLPDAGIPVVRDSQPLLRLWEGLRGLLSPLALAGLGAALFSCTLLGVGALRGWQALRRAFTSDLVILVVGVKLFEQVVSTRLPGYPPISAGELVSRSLGDLASVTLPGLGAVHGGSLLCLGLPALMGFLLGGTVGGLAATLPFLIPMMRIGEEVDPRLAVLAYLGAYLGAGLAGRGSLARLALAAACSALLVALLAFPG